MNNIYIGIDPSFRRYGFGVCIIDRADNTCRFLRLRDFLAFVSWFNHDAPADAVYCVENSNLTDATFSRYGIKGQSQLAKVSRNVGKNQAISQATVDIINHAGRFKLLDLSPADKGAKWSEKTAAAVAASKGLIIPAGALEKEDNRDALKLAILAEQREYKAKKPKARKKNKKA